MTVAELKAFLADKSDTDLIEVTMTPTYNIQHSIAPVPEVEAVVESAPVEEPAIAEGENSAA